MRTFPYKNRLLLAFSFCSLHAVAQNVGIGTSTPNASLNVAQNLTVLFGADTGVSAASRMVWYGAKSALHAGFGAYLDNGNSGQYSFAAGYYAKASGYASGAIGNFAVASGNSALAFGYNDQAEGTGSAAFNYSTYAKGDYSAAFGNSTRALSRFSMAIGVNNKDVPNALFMIGNGHSGVDFTVQSNAMVVMLDGKVGIGTNAPQALVEVSSSGFNAYAGIMISNSNVGGKPITINQGTLGKLNFTNPGVVDLVTMDFNSSRVGINSTNPTHLLQLGTDDAFKPATSTWGVLSDKRVKENIRDFSDGLELLKKIHPVWFDYNGEGGTKKGEHAVGTIAQELEEVAPYMVSAMPGANSNSRDLLGVNYHALFFILLNAVKEESRMIEALQEEVKELQSNHQ